MNHMKEIAALFGLELYQVFRIDSSIFALNVILFRFSTRYLEFLSTDADTGIIQKWEKADTDILYSLLNGEYIIHKPYIGTGRRQAYVKEKILTDYEHKYLANVIEPLAAEVVCITKTCSGNQINIFIETKNYNTIHPSIILPSMKKDEIFTGMEYGKHYTLEELGL